MFELPKDQTTVKEWAILRKLRVWIAALAVACLVAGIGIGAMLSGRTTVAQNQVQIARAPEARSEEHTSELQSQSNLVCRLLLEKRKRRPATPPAAPCPQRPR